VHIERENPKIAVAKWCEINQRRNSPNSPASTNVYPIHKPLDRLASIRQNGSWIFFRQSWICSFGGGTGVTYSVRTMADLLREI